ncbi:unnamed protein product [Leuciscus chuanchicus]
MPKAKAAQTDSNAETVTMASLTHLLESHRTAISEDFKQTFSALETKLNGVITTVTEHAEKLEILESEECERAHRALALKPPPNQRPRPIIIHLLRFQVKDKIIRHARTMRGRLKFRDHSILVFEDYPPEVVEQRKEFKTVMSELYERGFKPALLYLARLYIKMESGGRKHFPTVAEAEAFIVSLPSRNT